MSGSRPAKRKRKIFVVGPLCKNLHSHKGLGKSLRYASTWQCVRCHKIWTKRYQKLPEVMEKSRKHALWYHYEHRGRMLSKMRKYAKTEAGKAASRRHREKFRNQLNAATRKWKRANKKYVSEYNRIYAQSPRGKFTIRAKSHARRVKEERLRLPYTAIQLRGRFRRLGDKCLYCGSKQGLSVDHLIPIINGGFDCISNLVPACKPCNSKKNRIHPLEFARRVKSPTPGLMARLRRLLKAYYKFIGGHEK